MAIKYSLHQDQIDLSNVLLFFALIFIISSQSLAQIVTDRPDQSEGPTSVGQNNFQIESGWLNGDFLDDDATVDIIQFASLFRFGLTDRIELRIINQWEHLTTEENLKISGISDLVLGMKIHLFSLENIGTDIGVVTHISVPSAKMELSAGKLQSFNRLAVSHNINSDLSVSYNLGIDYLVGNRWVFPYTLTCAKAINEWFNIYLEAFGQFNQHHVGLNTDAGFTFLLNDNLQFDFSFGLGLSEVMNYTALGISWKIEGNSGE